MSLQGRVALVTGAGRGIGKVIAETLGRHGAATVVNYRRSEAGALAAAKAIRAAGSEAVTIRADASDGAEAKELVDRAAAWKDRLDILVNNVGDFLVKPVAEMETQELLDIMHSNVVSMFCCTRAALPHMRRGGWGRIINLGMAGAQRCDGPATMGAYFAAKAAVISLTKAIAAEEGKHGITANVVSPGIVEDKVMTVEEAKKVVSKQSPVGRPGTSEDIANAVLFLVSDGASFVTGNVIAVTGGWKI